VCSKNPDASEGSNLLILCSRNGSDRPFRKDVLGTLGAKAWRPVEAETCESVICTCVGTVRQRSGESSYPVESFTWSLVPNNGLVPAKSAALRSFLRWMLTDGQEFAEGLGYAGLPEELSRKELAIIGRL
jgi:phosphate transport system substrate-binding protein